MVRFVVVGGGAAGWITSHYLKRNLDCELTVVHKKENEIIGVGESTTPTILKVIEDVKSWQEDSKALIKYGIKFNSIADTMLMSYALDNGLTRHGMDDLAFMHFDYSTIKFDPDYLSYYPSYALFFTMNQYYLNEKNYK